MDAVGWGGIIQRECGSRQWRSRSLGLYDFFRTSSFRLRNFCFATLICIISFFSLFQSRGKTCLRFFAIARVVCICICLGENPSTEAALRPPFHCKGQSARKVQVQKKGYERLLIIMVSPSHSESCVRTTLKRNQRTAA